MKRASKGTLRPMVRVRSRLYVAVTVFITAVMTAVVTTGCGSTVAADGTASSQPNTGDDAPVTNSSRSTSNSTSAVRPLATPAPSSSGNLVDDLCESAQATTLVSQLYPGHPTKCATQSAGGERVTGWTLTDGGPPKIADINGNTNTAVVSVAMFQKFSPDILEAGTLFEVDDHKCSRTVSTVDSSPEPQVTIYGDGCKVEAPGVKVVTVSSFQAGASKSAAVSHLVDELTSLVVEQVGG